MDVINFFWSGDSFDLIHRASVLSHYYVGHEPVVWLHGDKPKSPYWIEDCQNKIIIKDAQDIFDVSSFIESGGNFKTASTLWSFYLLYQKGEIYCDTDHFALKQFPKSKWFILSGEKPFRNWASVGFIKTPKKEPFIKEAIDNIKKDWGNVGVFSEAYKKYYGTPIKYTHQNRLFYPYLHTEKEVLFNNVKIPNTYSIHIYHTFFDRSNIFVDEDYVRNKIPNSLLTKLIYYY